MIHKISSDPEIYSIYVELPENPLKNLNSYVLLSGGEALIIDTGFNRPECRRSLWEGIRELNLNLEMTSLFLTHLHSDHIGLAGDFAKQGCKIYMSQADYTYFKEIKEGNVWDYMERWFVSEGFPENEIVLQKSGNQARLYEPDVLFPAVQAEDGYEFVIGKERCQCISTPGHTPGHMVLYLPEHQILFAGDHILFDITPNISVYKSQSHTLSLYIDSLKKIQELPVRTLLPAHRNFNRNIRERIHRLLEHHAERLAEIAQAVKNNPDSTAFTIASKITWSARGRKFEEFSPNQKWFAMGETLAHLQYLLDHQVISVHFLNNVQVYCLADSFR